MKLRLFSGKQLSPFYLTIPVTQANHTSVAVGGMEGLGLREPILHPSMRSTIYWYGKGNAALSGETVFSWEPFYPFQRTYRLNERRNEGRWGMKERGTEIKVREECKYFGWLRNVRLLNRMFVLGKTKATQVPARTWRSGWPYYVAFLSSKGINKICAA